MMYNNRYTNAKDFYIGYKVLPGSLRRRYWLLAALFIIGFPLAGYVIASQQKSAGHGFWDTAEEVTLSGYLVAEPYPVLHLAVNNDTSMQSVMLVQVGKHAATALVSDYANQSVSITGFAITRGGWKMLEVTGPEAVSSASIETIVPPETTVIGDVSMKGKIVGTKCFLGVMKPGTGHVHKACAELCLLGGVPPMFVVEDEQGQQFGYLLADARNQSLSTALAKMTEQPVSVSGELQRRGDLLYIQLDANNVVKL